MVKVKGTKIEHTEYEIEIIEITPGQAFSLIAGKIRLRIHYHDRQNEYADQHGDYRLTIHGSDACPFSLEIHQPKGKP